MVEYGGIPFFKLFGDEEVFFAVIHGSQTLVCHLDISGFRKKEIQQKEDCRKKRCHKEEHSFCLLYIEKQLLHYHVIHLR